MRETVAQLSAENAPRNQNSAQYPIGTDYEFQCAIVPSFVQKSFLFQKLITA